MAPVLNFFLTADSAPVEFFRLNPNIFALSDAGLPLSRACSFDVALLAAPLLLELLFSCEATE